MFFCIPWFTLNVIFGIVGILGVIISFVFQRQNKRDNKYFRKEMKEEFHRQNRITSFPFRSAIGGCLVGNPDISRWLGDVFDKQDDSYSMGNCKAQTFMFQHSKLSDIIYDNYVSHTGYKELHLFRR